MQPSSLLVISLLSKGILYYLPIPPLSSDLLPVCIIHYMWSFVAGLHVAERCPHLCCSLCLYFISRHAVGGHLGSVHLSTVINNADTVSPPFKIHLPAYLWGHPCHSVCMEGKGQFCGVSSLLPPLYRFQVSPLLLKFFNKEFSMFLSQVYGGIYL